MVLPLFPLARLDLHNVYNGLEMVLIVMGFKHEVDARADAQAGDQPRNTVESDGRTWSSLASSRAHRCDQ